MTIGSNLKTFAGKPVEDWHAGESVGDWTGIVYRLRLDWEELDGGMLWADKFAAFLDQPGIEAAEALVVGTWQEPYETSSNVVVKALVAARHQLPNLKALFLGDITYEECEISWIVQSNVTPVLTAYPSLEHFTVRGGKDLMLAGLRHSRLRELVVQSGGLSTLVVRQVLAADLPELRHLDLWLGDSNYGGDTTVEDLAPLLAGDLFPKLTYLGLRDSEIVDDLATAVADAPVVERLRVLDLSLGNLSDEGAEALLGSPSIAKLEKLDLHHHYLSDEMMARFESLETEVDLTDRKEPDEYEDQGQRYSVRYIAVAE